MKAPHDSNIQTTLRELPLDKLEKLDEMLASLKSDGEAIVNDPDASKLQ